MSNDHDATPDISIHRGMNREDVEEQIAKANGLGCEYTVYNSNLSGGVVRYQVSGKTLEVTYNPGALAPYAPNQDGNIQHFPPVDETVERFSWMDS